MSNTKVLHSFFKRRVVGGKQLLYVLAAVLLLTDTAVALASIISGVPFLHWFAPLMFAVLDIFFLPVIYFSNFRFSYSRIFPIVYALISAGLSVYVIVTAATSLFTYLALILFAAAHACALVALLAVLRLSARVGKRSHKLLTFAVLLVTVAVAALYAFCAMGNGFYGQGTSATTRNIVYELDQKTDTYIARDVLPGKGERLVIPDTHNGKRVSAVDGAVFADTTLSEIYLDCGADITLLSDSKMEKMTASVFIAKDEVDTLKAACIAGAKTQPAFVALCNSILPSALPEGEVYITFAYTEESLRYADYHQIPTWYGQAGDTFVLGEHADGVYYAEGYDPRSEAFLAKSFHNNEKVLAPLMHKGADLDRATVTESLTAIPVSFENVYAVAIGHDNDALYEVEDSFKFLPGETHRYVLGNDPYDLLSTVKPRAGFDISFEYTVDGGSRFPLDRLSDVLTRDELTVYPVWTLRAPEIDKLIADRENKTYIYGEDATLESLAISPDATIALRYEWFCGDEALGTVSEQKLTNLLPTEAHEYTLLVTAYSDTLTSLTATSAQSITLTVNKRPLSFEWSLPDSHVYSGSDKPIGATVVGTDTVNGDTVNAVLDITSVRNVGTYLISLTLEEEMAELYTVRTADARRTLTITPYEVTLDWSNTAFVYDAALHAPTAVGYGVGDEAGEPVGLSVLGARKDAGTALQATAVSNDENYTFTNPTQEFAIAKRPITLIWESTSSFVYNAAQQAPTVRDVQDAVTDEVATLLAGITYTGTERNVGDAYTVTAVLNNGNYTVEANPTKDFSITRKPLTIAWENTSLVYNGQAQRPSAVFDGVEVADAATFLVQYSDFTSAVHVGEYSVTASINNENYQLPSDVTGEYEITKRGVTPVWSGTDLVYNGATQPPMVTALRDVVSADSEAALLSLIYGGDVAGKNAGSYTLSVSFPSDSDYYVKEAASCNYTIKQKPLTLDWGPTVLTYTGVEQHPEATVVGAVVGETVELIYTNWSGNKDVRNYTVTVEIADGNYSLADRTRSYEITPAPLTLTWDTPSFIYNGEAQYPEVTVSGMVNDEDAPTVSYNGWNDNIAAGQHSVSVTITDPNYKLPANKVHTYEIARRLLTLSWGTASLPYEGIAQHPEVTLGNVASGDDVRPTYLNAGRNVNVGQYTVSISISNSNYRLPDDVSCTYEITPVGLTVSWDQTTFEFNGSTHRPKATLSNMVAGETVAVFYSSAAQRNAGDYEVSISITNPNYLLLSNTSTPYSITPKALTVTWPTTLSFVYTGEVQYPRATLNGTVAGEPVTLIYSDYTTHIDAGDYEVSVSINNPNYVLSSDTTCSYTITKRELTFEWSGEALIYNGTAQKPELTIGNVATAAPVTPVYTIWSGNKNAGTHSVRVTGVGNDNYILPENVTCSYTIAKKEVTVAWNGPTSFEYNGEAQKPTPTLSGVIRGETVDISYTDWSGHINVGRYSVTVESNNSNYKLTGTTTCEYFITKKSLIARWENTPTFTYDGTAKCPSLPSLIGLASGDTVNAVYVATYNNVAVGRYSVSVELDGDDMGNYIISGAHYTYEITPRAVTVTWSDDAEMPYTGTAQSPEATLVGVLGADDAEMSYVYYKGTAQLTSAPTAAGEYRVKVVLGNGCYTVSENDEFTFTILPAAEGGV